MSIHFFFLMSINPEKAVNMSIQDNESFFIQLKTYPLYNGICVTLLSHHIALTQHLSLKKMVHI